MTRWAALIAALLAALPAGAQCIGLQCPPGVLGAATGISAPLNNFTTPSGAYSFRKLLSAYTGNAVRLRRASDNAESDIGFVGSNFDTAAAVAHCAATTCFVSKWYDQSGNGRDGQRAIAEQPPLAFGCNAGLPCVQGTTSTHILNTLSNYTPVLPGTYNTVGRRSAGAGTCTLVGQYAAFNQIIPAPAGFWQLGTAGGVINAAAAENTWHSGTGVINGASSVLRIDAAETTGTVTGSVTAGVFVLLFGAAATTCAVQEVVHWGGYAMPAGERAALQTNQKNFWGTP